MQPTQERVATAMGEQLEAYGQVITSKLCPFALAYDGHSGL